jgi:flagellin-like hook-associated protein FlgL
VSAINTAFGSTVASNSSNQLRLTAGNNVDTISVAAGSAATALGLSTTTVNPGSSTTANPKRAELVETYNDLLGQIDALAKDAGFNGVNLLNGDDLSVLFNETGTSKLDIEGVTNSATGLGLSALTSTAFDSNSSINNTLDDLKGAIETLKSQSAKFGSNLSVVETRQTFTKEMINVLETGASNLTLADTNEEAANVLALQTRQQLSSTALSLASSADQNVLRLF